PSICGKRSRRWPRRPDWLGLGRLLLDGCRRHGLCPRLLLCWIRLRCRAIGRRVATDARLLARLGEKSTRPWVIVRFGSRQSCKHPIPGCNCFEVACRLRIQLYRQADGSKAVVDFVETGAHSRLPYDFLSTHYPDIRKAAS